MNHGVNSEHKLPTRVAAQEMNQPIDFVCSFLHDQVVSLTSGLSLIGPLDFLPLFFFFVALFFAAILSPHHLLLEI